MIMKEMLSCTWAEQPVVSDIMGQKLFLIQNDSLTFGPLAVLNTVYLAKYPMTFSKLYLDCWCVIL